MTRVERDVDRVARGVSGVGYVVKVAQRLGYNLRDSGPSKRGYEAPEARASLSEMLGGLLTTTSSMRCSPVRHPVPVDHHSRTGLLQLTNRNGANIDTHRHPSSTALAEATFILCLSRELIRVLDGIVFISSHIELNHVDVTNGNMIQKLNAAWSRGSRSHRLLNTLPSPGRRGPATIELGEGYVSIDNIDKDLLHGSSSSNARDQDPVLACIRIRPIDLIYAWISSPPGSAAPGSVPAPSDFSNVLTGTLSTRIYAATEG
ncbi:hypothetical protein FIBSPDRAFT_962792 [Athelia psychrophila]|uniref:Uncharacterized protein n=1 Tax=Athelia psychrophila TaxID=1759441 RepID=A0A165ZQ01_9AGAM|nr:hypothetical protein FIBSPDRAFT_962792 [Fibularhizoctonia sp. CBS 109695]